MPDSTEAKPKTKKCPFCAETIQAQAVKCRYCCEFLDPRYNYTSAPPAPPSGHFDPVRDVLEPADEGEDGGENESLYSSRPSVFALSKTLIGCGLMLALALFLCFYPLDHIIKPTGELTDQHTAALIGYMRLIGFSLAAATLLLAAYKIAELKTIHYEVTADRIEWSRGLFAHQKDNLDMFRIQDYTLQRTVWDRVLGIGTLTIISKDQSDPQFSFVKVRRPQRLYEVIKKFSLEADRKQRVVHFED